MNEVNYKDLTESKTPSVKNFQDIKPSEGMTYKEAADFWTSEQKSQSAAEQKQKYLDDNGKEFRDGDKLKPNETFTVNGYEYKTDNKGRVISAEGPLRLKDPDYKRNMEDVKKLDSQEYNKGDQRGHLIPHQFGGSDKLENLVPMDAKLNQKDLAKIENTLADAVKSGAKADYKIEPVYKGDSRRPSEFKVTYSIDGDKEVAVFKNESRE